MEALRKQLKVNEELQRQLEQLTQGTNVLERIKQLEDEKNALLDYIEENIEKSVQSPLQLGSTRVMQGGADHQQLQNEINRLS